MQILKVFAKKKPNMNSEFNAYTPLDFSDISAKTKGFAKVIEENREALTNILLEYESFEVAEDETKRTLDLLLNLRENEEYFKLRIGRVAAFLPRNQPLYALTCFVIVPSLMAREVHFRIPSSMKEFLPKILKLLDIKGHFPNVHPSEEQHHGFLKKHTALKVDPKTQETIPVTDAVIFTGTPVRADQLRSIFDSRTLFITNGSGHNPVIVSEDADIEEAVEAVLCVQLYNQGQDCAAPNAILVHKNVISDFNRLLHIKLPTYKVGHYSDRSCKIGPISDPFDLVRVEDLLIRHKDHIDPQAPGILRSKDAIVEPTIISKPLKYGGNYTEMFAPIIYIQEYESDKDLSLYFENEDYYRNAMYVTVYGTSEYAKSLIGHTFKGKLLHDASTLLFNTHLHADGVERGTKPYGGYGYGASNLYIRGEGVSKPTLPQRDIYEQVARPILEKGTVDEYQKHVSSYTDIQEKNIEKLLRIASQSKAPSEDKEFSYLYFDLNVIDANSTKTRYVKFDPSSTYKLLLKPNVLYITDLTPESVNQIRKLRELVQNKPQSEDEFATSLYGIVGDYPTKEDKLAQQKKFFGNVYQLLFGQKSGPKLTIFLWEVEADKICELLDI